MGRATAKKLCPFIRLSTVDFHYWALWQNAAMTDSVGISRHTCSTPRRQNTLLAGITNDRTTVWSSAALQGLNRRVTSILKRIRGCIILELSFIWKEMTLKIPLGSQKAVRRKKSRYFNKFQNSLFVWECYYSSNADKRGKAMRPARMITSTCCRCSWCNLQELLQ